MRERGTRRATGSTAVGTRTPEQRRSLNPPIIGRVIDDTAGYPVAGTRLRLIDRSRSDAVEVAETTTTDDGAFRISEISEPDGDCDCLVLTVELPGARTPVTEQNLALPATEALTVQVPMPPARVTAAQWRTIGRRARDARIGRLDELARALLSASGGPFGAVPLVARYTAVRMLEAAFLDPANVLGDEGGLTFAAIGSGDGLAAMEQRLDAPGTSRRIATAIRETIAKVSVFGSIVRADWLIDPDAIADGRLDKSVDRFKDIHRKGPGGLDVDIDFDPEWMLPTSTLVSYRDYLRTIFTGATDSDGYGQHLGTLQARFKQDFQTKNDSDQTANEIVVDIVRGFLVAPTGTGHGFGVDPSSIEAQGDRTPREYLDYLIPLSGLNQTALGHHTRLDLSRPDGVVSSPVWENVFSLRRLYSDDFQIKGAANSIIPASLEGLPPFYLQYEEWLEKNATFFGENYYRPQDTFFIDLAEGMREKVKEEAAKPGADPLLAFLEAALQVQDELIAGNVRMEQLEYGLAREHYRKAIRLADSALWKSFGGKWGTIPYPPTVLSTIGARMNAQLALPMDGPAHLDAYVTFFRFTIYGLTSTFDIEQWITNHHDDVRHSLLHLAVLVLPTLLGDIALITGDYGGAVFNQEVTTGFVLSRAKASDTEGWAHDPYPIPTVHDPETYRDPYVEGGLPYANPTKEMSWFPYWSPHGLFSPGFMVALAAELVKQKKIHRMERRFFALRHGSAMLDWADSLYRSDEPSSIQRARELYKAVLWLHGEPPPIGAPASGTWPFFFHFVENAALTSQRNRALVGLAQIDAGLNYYGANDSVVPQLRYRALKDAADRFGASARAAQQDFLLAIGKVEDALKEELVTANMLKKAQLQAKIADEQAKIAQVGVQLAQQQVKAVEAQIAAKQQEIEDHDSLFSQFKETFSGMAGVIGGMPAGLTGGLKEGAMVGTGLSSASSGSVWTSGVAAGGAVLGAYALFLYAGITSMQAMTDAQTSREKQLMALKYEALPLAKAQVDARQREVGIAGLQRAIADADAQLAAAIIHFQRNRFLNVTFWAELGLVMRRVMRRYLVLGGRYGWLAERALAYEQDRPLDIIRFDYFPERLQGVTGADLLAADLGELDAARLEGMRRTVPVQRTYSLAFDFPLSFGQLKQTGRCTFLTDEDALTAAYPGTYGYRIRAVTASVQSYAGASPARGMLTNLGASFLTRADGSRHISLRTVDALPLSEFRLAKDMEVYGLPDETLMPFEGSGIETSWILEFAAQANLDLSTIADVQLTVDTQAQFSASLREAHLAALSGDVRRLVFYSGAYQDPTAIEQLHGTTPIVTFDFDLLAKGMPAGETNRKIANVVVLAGATKPISFAASLKVGTSTVQFSVENGVAMSTASPLTDAQSTIAPSPLDALAGKAVPKTAQLKVTRNASPGADFKTVQDIVLGIEYTATAP